MKPLVAIALSLCLHCSAAATVSIEFQLGAVNVPPGSLGVLVADTAGNGFQSPAGSPGTPLAAGSNLGPDDVVVTVFFNADLPEWGTQRGFAGQFAAIDYGALGVAEGQELILYVFPDRAAGDPVRSGEPHLAYRAGDLGELTANSSMGFALPADGGAYLLAALAPQTGGSADLSSVDIAPLPVDEGAGLVERDLSTGARHTYYFEMLQAGALSVFGSGGSGLRGELFDRNGQLVAASDGSGDFRLYEDLGVGFHSLVIFQDPDASGGFSYELDFASGAVRFTRPDVAVGKSPRRLRGVGVYAAPSGQKVVLVSRKLRRARGHAVVANRGALPDSMTVRAKGGNRLFKVLYHGAEGNLTASLTRGAYRTAAIDEGDADTRFRVTVKPNRRKLTKNRGGRRIHLRRNYNLVVRANSTLEPSRGDAAKFRVRTR